MFPFLSTMNTDAEAEAVAEEVEDVVAGGDVVVLAGVEDGEVGTGFCEDRLGAAQGRRC